MRHHRLNRLTVLTLLLLFPLVAACNPALKPLKTAKANWEKRDFVSLAAMDIPCEASDKGCNQLHLIKGDACFRLAKNNVETERHLACAVNHLQTGIAQTTDWQMKKLDLDRGQTYENLLESLRLWQDTKQGTEADKVTRQLISSAQELLKAEPDHLAGIYFLNSGAYTLLRGELLRQTQPQQLCTALNHIFKSLSAAEPRALGTKYAPNFERLRLDVRAAKTTVTGCR